MKYLYRCIAGPCELNDAGLGGGYLYIKNLEYNRYEVVKETEKGYWITRRAGWPASWIKKINHTECRFVLKGEGKRFASETKEQALYNLTRRAYARRDILYQQAKENDALINYLEVASDRP